MAIRSLTMERAEFSAGSAYVQNQNSSAEHSTSAAYASAQAAGAPANAAASAPRPKKAVEELTIRSCRTATADARASLTSAVPRETTTAREGVMERRTRGRCG